MNKKNTNNIVENSAGPPFYIIKLPKEKGGVGVGGLMSLS